MKVNVLLQGEIGTGKTYCLRTLLKCELEPFVISMEPGLNTTLQDVLCPKEAIHYHYIPPGEVTWEQIRKYAVLAATLPLSRLITTQDPSRSEYTQYLDLFNVCKKFICHGCQQDFGDVAKWGEDRAIAIDGLTGLTQASRQMVIGARPVIGRDEYQPIQGFIDAFLTLLWGKTGCSAIVTAHIDRRANEITGINQVTIDTAGPALVRKLVRKPDEIITTERTDKGKFVWNTEHSPQIVMKHRLLPESQNLEPDFSQIFKT